MNSMKRVPPPAATDKYTRTAQALHWLMALIWLASWGAGMVAAHVPALNPHHGLTAVHKAVASTLLALVVIRVAWRLAHPAPALPPSMSVFMQRAAHLGHLVLYALALIALPLSGWYWSSVAGRAVQLAGLFTLPPLAAPDEAMRDLAANVHVLTAWFCGALVGGHIVVALKHRFIDRDSVMASMLPGPRGLR
ncbi:cytochrome b [Cupriavidus sp. 30B13]|uniref:cytochrome b n=1 Tax=Cupriavidus sp. 30B13 TaxID=3384241 RepID=UPI003B8F0036